MGLMDSLIAAYACSGAHCLVSCFLKIDPNWSGFEVFESLRADRSPWTTLLYNVDINIWWRNHFCHYRMVMQASSEQRGRLAMSTEKLNQSSDRIKESRRTMLETEELGVSILQDLHLQRQTLLHAHEKVCFPLKFCGHFRSPFWLCWLPIHMGWQMSLFPSYEGIKMQQHCRSCRCVDWWFWYPLFWYLLRFWLFLQLHDVDSAIDKSKKILTTMSKRLSRNKWIVGSVISVLVLAIIFILYFKLSWHQMTHDTAWVMLNFYVYLCVYTICGGSNHTMKHTVVGIIFTVPL